MVNLSDWTGSNIYGALGAKFQSDVLNPFVLICGFLCQLTEDHPSSFKHVFVFKNAVCWNKYRTNCSLLLWHESYPVFQRIFIFLIDAEGILRMDLWSHVTWKLITASNSPQKNCHPKQWYFKSCSRQTTRIWRSYYHAIYAISFHRSFVTTRKKTVEVLSWWINGCLYTRLFSKT